MDFFNIYLYDNQIWKIECKNVKFMRIYTEMETL